MKTIYQHISGRGYDRRTTQGVDATLVAEIRGHRFRVTIHFDTSYAHQSRGEIAHLVGGRFEPVLDLHGSDEIPCAKAYHAMTAPQRGTLERDGSAFENAINDTLAALARLGAEIVT